jgi:superfamily II DNA/RNA helicase
MKDIPHLKVPIKGRYEVILHDRKGKRLEDVIDECESKHKRILVIHPNKHKVLQLANSLKLRGFGPLCSTQRDLPPKHIIATSIVDAGITIDGCDCVIDTCKRVVNDGGERKTVEVDSATRIQRMGRTGRTCPGHYYFLGDTADKEYRPAPDIISILSDDDSAKHFKVVNTLIKQEVPYLPGDNYVVLASRLNDPDLLGSISLLVKLLHGNPTSVDAYTAYARIHEGYPTDAEDFLLDLCEVTRLLPLARIKKEFKSLSPNYYSMDAQGFSLHVTNNRLQIL